MSSDTDRPEDSTPQQSQTTSTEPVGNAEDSADRATASEAHNATAESGTAAAEPGEPTSGPADAAASETGGTADRYNVEYNVEPDSPKLHPALIATAVALPVGLIIAVLIVAVVSRQHPARKPLALGSVPQSAATGPTCTALLPALPDRLGDYTRVTLAKPAPPATMAWQLPAGGDPIVLRCGLDRPAEFTKAAALQIINGVNWFEVRDPTSGNTSGTWYIVDRSTYIAVTMPDKAGPTPLQDISNATTKVLPPRPLDPGPIPS